MRVLHLEHTSLMLLAQVAISTRRIQERCSKHTVPLVIREERTFNLLLSGFWLLWFIRVNFANILFCF